MKPRTARDTESTDPTAVAASGPAGGWTAWNGPGRATAPEVEALVVELRTELRERRVLLPDEALAAIGRLAHAANQRSAGREGGRIVRKLLADLVEAPLHPAALAHPDDYANARTAEFAPVPESSPPRDFPFEVHFRADDGPIVV